MTSFWRMSEYAFQLLHQQALDKNSCEKLREGWVAYQKFAWAADRFIHKERTETKKKTEVPKIEIKTNWDTVTI